EPRAEQQREQRHEAAGPSRRDEAERRGRGAERQEPALAEALGEEAGRNLERRHTARVCGADQADLRKRETELARPEWEEDVERLREAVVQEMDRRRGDENGARPILHGPIIPGGASLFK